MPKIPSYKHLELVLKSVGFIFIRQTGSHVHFIKDGKLITVARHGNKEISIGVFGQILRELGLSRDEFWKIWRD